MQSTTQILTTLALQKRDDSSVLISDTLRGALSPDYLKNISLSIEQAHKQIELSSSLPGFELNAEAVMMARARIEDYIREKLTSRGQINERMLLKLLNLGIASQRAGNCYEFAFFTKSLLEKIEVDTSVFRVKNPKNQDSHVFLVANLKASSQIDDFHSWNPEAIIIDPFMKKIYSPKELLTYLEVCVFDEQTEKVSYVAFKEEIHVLDNSAQKDLLDDWQIFINIMNAKKADPDPSIAMSSTPQQ